MREYVKKLRSKPEPVKKQILIGSLIVSMSLVCLVWVSSLGYRFGNDEDKVAKTNEAAKPFALFGQTITDTYNNITASVGNISSSKEQNVEEETVVEEKQIDLIPIENQMQQ